MADQIDDDDLICHDVLNPDFEAGLPDIPNRDDYSPPLPNLQNCRDMDSFIEEARQIEFARRWEKVLFRLQSKDEPLHQYVFDKERLCLDCDESLQDTKKQILSGLRSAELSRAMAVREHGSTNELLCDMFKFEREAELARANEACDCSATAAVTSEELFKRMEKYTRIDNELCLSIAKFTDDLSELADGQQNFVFSGFSAHAALSVCATGASGPTANQMHIDLHHPQFDFLKSYESLIKFFREANSTSIGINTLIFINRTVRLKGSLLNTLNTFFPSAVEEVDFSNYLETQRIINERCNDSSGSRFDDVASSVYIDEKTKFLLVNTFHLEARWKESFMNQNTMELPFYLSFNESVLRVPMMRSNSMSIPYMCLEDLDAECVGIPYENEDFLFVVIKPTNYVDDPEGHNYIDGLKAVENKMKKVHLDYRTIARSRSDKNCGFIELYMPIFRIRSDTNMKNYLSKNLKMEYPFGADWIDLTELFDTSELESPLQIDNMFQSTGVLVNETGSYSPGPEIGHMEDLRSGSVDDDDDTITRFKVDRPFLFRIVNVSKNIVLLSGRVVVPHIMKALFIH